MRVAIDISPIKGIHQYRGVGVYTKLLVNSLKDYDKNNEYILTTKTKLANVDLIHYPFFDFFFLSLPFLKLKPTIITIHDTIPLIYPDNYPPGIRGKIKFKLQKQSLKGARAIVTDSDKSKQDISQYLGIPENLIHRVYLAANPLLTPRPYTEQKMFREKYAIKKPYLLYVGDINFNKNLERLIKAYAPFSKELDLVLVSRSLSKNILEARVINALIESNHLSQSIYRITDLVQDPNILAAAYSGACWYIQPSLYEGFGLPVLEAMQCGVPVLASNGGSLPEVTGNAALVFDPTNLKDMTSKIETILGMTKKERAEYIKLGYEQASKFSWKLTVKRMVEIYENVLAK